eukprot:403354232
MNREDLEIIYAYFSKKTRKTAKFLLKCLLFSMIVLLEIFLQSSMLFTIVGLCFWVLILIIFTSPLWIPLAILWCPAGILIILTFRYTKVGEKVFNFVEKLFYYMMYKTTWCRKLIWKAVYNLFAWYMQNETKLTSFNCGYAILTQTGETIKLVAKNDRKNQFQYQMYHFAALGVKNLEALSDKRILDVGSGRGGGLAFLSKYYEPIEAVGIDFSHQNIRFCNQRFREIENLFYYQGDAEKLHKTKFLKNQVFDLVLCIETFHCLSNPFNTLRNMRPLIEENNGSVIIVDIFYKKDLERMETIFKDALYQIEKKEILTINVKHSMNLDKSRSERLIQTISENKYIVRILRNFLASAEESRTYQDLGKTKEYICYVLKPCQNQQQSSVTADGSCSTQTQGSLSVNNNPQNSAGIKLKSSLRTSYGGGGPTAKYTQNYEESQDSDIQQQS